MRQTPSRERLRIEWDLHEFGPRPLPETAPRPARPALAAPPAGDPAAARHARPARLTEKVA